MDDAVGRRYHSAALTIVLISASGERADLEDVQVGFANNLLSLIRDRRRLRKVLHMGARGTRTELVKKPNCATKRWVSGLLDVLFRDGEEICWNSTNTS